MVHDRGLIKSFIHLFIQQCLKYASCFSKLPGESSDPDDKVAALRRFTF